MFVKTLSEHHRTHFLESKMAAKFKMAASLFKMVYCYGHLSSFDFPNDFYYLFVCSSSKITKKFHWIHTIKSKMASNFKMAAILP